MHFPQTPIQHHQPPLHQIKPVRHNHFVQLMIHPLKLQAQHLNRFIPYALIKIQVSSLILPNTQHSKEIILLRMHLINQLNDHLNKALEPNGQILLLFEFSELVFVYDGDVVEEEIVFGGELDFYLLDVRLFPWHYADFEDLHGADLAERCACFLLAYLEGEDEAGDLGEVLLEGGVGLLEAGLELGVAVLGGV